ncbi:RsmE family RNA methyltransferase [Sinobacterium caligoides]|uniref:Ribosomal RNA small subunit methyltransferase E n=1 Tax=Sinobacterium caligoides TaxID=933926 RepID=A0A3N2E0W4_9GAMM|nr:16S rRNA (uracil(1498)-N(3))-methyltransferase [Sinobacterium caligoides]ROS05748.1 RsmE family RNA methyltransferase [Sinobacterium caligoides]
MNIILLHEDDFISPTCVRLSDHRLTHILKVIRAKEGDTLKVGRLNGKLGSGLIEQLDSDSCQLAVTLEQAPPPATPITLVLALSRPKMMRRIYRMAAEFGLKELYVINSYKTEKSFWQSPVVEADTVHRYLLEGLEQCVDTVLPTVHFKPRFKPFVEDELPAIATGKRALVAHPGDHAPCPIAVKEPMILAIGPEGGFIPYEVDKLVEAGFETVSLGPRILRVENAVSTLTARLYDGACDR